MTLVNTAIKLEDLPAPPEGKTGWPWIEGTEPLPDKMPDGSEWPRISIVTPSYNQGQFIEETIRSILLQGYPNLEYIIIDGGSTDNSVEVIQKYKYYLAYFKSEKDNGQSDALNKGFAVSTGLLMGWLNSDDLLTKNALYTLATYYKPGLKWWTGAGIQILEDRTYNYLKKDDIIAVSRNKLLYARLIICQVATFWNRELWNKTGALIKPINLAMDYELWLRFSKYSSAYPIPQHLGFFRTHNQAKTGSEDGFKLYLKECDMVRSQEYKNSNIPFIIRVILIWFWNRFVRYQKYGWTIKFGK